MQALEDESQRVLKKQRLSAGQIDRQLDVLLEEVESAKRQLVKKQDELRRKKSRSSRNGEQSGSGSSDGSSIGQDRSEGTSDSAEASASNGVDSGAGSSEERTNEAATEGVQVEAQDDAMELIVRDFIRRVRLLHVEKNVAAELKAIHVLLSKYSKQIDKVMLFSGSALLEALLDSQCVAT